MTLSRPCSKPGWLPRALRLSRLRIGIAQTKLVWEERGKPVNLLPAYGTGIPIHVEHLADYLSRRGLRDVETRWNELFPAYEALGVN